MRCLLLNEVFYFCHVASVLHTASSSLARQLKKPKCLGHTRAQGYTSSFLSTQQPLPGRRVACETLQGTAPALLKPAQPPTPSARA